MANPKRTKKRVYSYLISLIPDEGGYTVLVPSLPGCVSYERTIDEATKMAKEAISLHIQNLKAHGLAYPDEDSKPVLNTTISVAV